MPQHAASLSALLPIAFAMASAPAIFGFGKRKNAPDDDADDELLEVNTPEPESEESEEEEESPDDDGRTLPLLATFPPLSDASASEAIIAACHEVWAALGVTEREETSDETLHAPRLFALSAVDSADAGREAVSQSVIHLAAAATSLGYSVLIIDADLDHPSLHRLPPFNQSIGDTPPPGVAEFLCGEASKIEPLVRMAWRTEGLLLLPAGVADSADGVLTKRSPLDRLLRLTGSFAEIVLLLAPPLFATSESAAVEDLLPRANGVVIAFPSKFTATADTEAQERLAEMEAEMNGGIVVPPIAFVDVLAVPPVPEAPIEEPTSPPQPEVTSLPEALPPPATPEVPETETPPPSRPTFFHPAPTAPDKPRGNTRRVAPIDTIPADVVAPSRQNRPVPAVPIATTMSTTYRPDITLEMLPASETATTLVLRANIGNADETGPALLLELRTAASEAKRLRAENPGTGAATNAPLLILEALTAAEAPEDATTLRLVVRESSASDAATLLEASLETPEAMRIKSGAAKATGVPPVRFEVTSLPDGTSRFRATVPPLGNTPSLFIDLERTTNDTGRYSRVLLHLATV